MAHLSTFDPPDSIAIFSGFSFGLNLYINPEGVITGGCFDPDSNNIRGHSPCLRAGSQRHFHYIRRSELSTLLNIFISLRY